MPAQKHWTQIQDQRLETFVVELPETGRSRTVYAVIGGFFLILTALAIYVMTTAPQLEIGF
jgi:LPXTG-motif cell wall-anchored protein